MRILPIIVASLWLLTGPATAQLGLGYKPINTLAAARTWAVETQRYSTWHGWLLYQGSDTAAHHFIGRIMDEWTWFIIRRAELTLTDERPYRRSSSAPLGYYYVDATHDFVRTKDYPTR